MDVVCPLTYSVHSVFPQRVQRSRESSLVVYHQVCGVRYPLRFQKSNPVVFRRCEAFWTPVPSGSEFDTVHVILLYAIRDQRR
jgi:hypothetical protein